MRVGISVLAFLVAFVALRQFAPGGVLFYQGVALACLAALVHWLVARRARPPARSPVKDVLLVLLASYAFMFTVPTTVDRSYSVRMLRHLQQMPDGATRAELQDYFAQDFVRQGGVDRRLLEQERTGSTWSPMVA